MVEAQQQKLQEIVAHKRQSEDEVAGSVLPFVPRWIQWGVGMTIEHLEEQIAAIERVSVALEPDVKLTDRIFEQVGPLLWRPRRTF